MSARHFDGPSYHREGIVQALRDYELEHGEVPTREEWDGSGPPPTSRTVARIFGTWNQALRAAGMQPRREAPCRSVPSSRLACTCLDEPGHAGACICACGRTPADRCTTLS